MSRNVSPRDCVGLGPNDDAISSRNSAWSIVPGRLHAGWRAGPTPTTRSLVRFHRLTAEVVRIRNPPSRGRGDGHDKRRIGAPRSGIGSVGLCRARLPLRGRSNLSPRAFHDEDLESAGLRSAGALFEGGSFGGFCSTRGRAHLGSHPYFAGTREGRLYGCWPRTPLRPSR